MMSSLKIRCGDFVVLYNLETDYLNGLIGQVQGEFQNMTKRWPVRVHWVGGKLKCLKPVNLWTEESFMSKVNLFCHPKVLAMWSPEDVLHMVSSVVAGYETVSRDLTRKVFGDHRILEFLADHYLDCVKPDPRIWGLLLFFDKNCGESTDRRKVVSQIMNKAAGHLQKEWKLFRQGENWKVAPKNKEDGAARLWILFGEKLGCKKVIDWAVFMWFLIQQNPLFNQIIHKDLEDFPNFNSKLPTMKKCSHPLRCGHCEKVEGNGVRLKQCFRCGLKRYCSKKCHEKDWVYHQSLCLCQHCFNPFCGSTKEKGCELGNFIFGLHFCPDSTPKCCFPD